MTTKRKIDALNNVPLPLKARFKLLDHRTESKEILAVQAKIREAYAEAAVKIAELIDGAAASGLKFDVGRAINAQDQMQSSKDTLANAFTMCDETL